MAGLGGDTFGYAGCGTTPVCQPCLVPATLAISTMGAGGSVHPASSGEIMTDTQTSQAQPANTADLSGNHDSYHQHPPSHEDFHWVEGLAQGSPYANFLETTLDIVAGIHVSLQIAYSSDLERAANGDADEGETVAPAVGIVESDQLVRFSIAAAGLLRDEARRRVEVLND
jgi:hypothetical protein